MEIKFVGAGSAFNKEDGQSNILVTANSGKKLLVDCGSAFWVKAQETAPDLKYTDIDALYVSHLHADHVGGIEELAFCTYFNPKANRPKLFCNVNLMHELWNESLRGGLESIQGKVVTLTEYFECCPVEASGSFDWEDIFFIPVQTVHVMAGYHIKYSYGLLVRTLEGSELIFITTDTQFCPNQIMDFYKKADIIFQDCETSPFKSGVHAHYSELVTLPYSIKSKMWLYHYQPNPQQKPMDEGFLGFVKAGQAFEF